MFILRCLLCLLLIVNSNAQTATIVDAAGNSVVVVTTTDAAGATLTQTIQTLPPAGQVPPTTPPLAAPAATTTTTSPTTTTTQAPAPPPVQGPVGQPGPTPDDPGGVTPYTYTTVINGVTTAIADNFTPSAPGTTPFTATGTGTVWAYSQYISEYGGPQATGGGSKNPGQQNHASSGLVVMSSLFMILIL